MSKISKLGRQSLLASLSFEGDEVGVWIVAEAGAGGPGLPPSVEGAAQVAPARVVVIG